MMGNTSRSANMSDPAIKIVNIDQKVSASRNIVVIYWVVIG